LIGESGKRVHQDDPLLSGALCADGWSGKDAAAVSAQASLTLDLKGGMTDAEALRQGLFHCIDDWRGAGDLRVGDL
jgi:hypothetical protein